MIEYMHNQLGNISDTKGRTMEINWPANSKSEISAKVVYDGVVVQHAGTGCYDEYYSPIVIEWYDGVPRIIIWADINDPDPTHVIDMSKALESNRHE
jgi:hypothetical protein